MGKRGPWRESQNAQSTSGFLTRIGTGAISWASKLQNIVTLSTTEAEVVASVFARSYGYRIFSLNLVSHLYIDNQLALSVAKNPEHHGQTKTPRPQVLLAAGEGRSEDYSNWIRTYYEGTAASWKSATDALWASGGLYQEGVLLYTDDLP